MMTEEDFDSLTKNLVIVALHEGVLGQMMHFPNPKGKFKIMQLTIQNGIPIDVLRFVIAHELGHATQGRNWIKSDGSKLKADADERAAKWGFKRKKKIDSFIKNSWKKSDRC